MEFVRRNKYALKCDIRKFYPSISHDIMFDIVKKSVTDERMLGILRDIIHSVQGGKNVPIGNLCSQWFGNLYLHELDMFVKQSLRCKCYLRYSDDFCLFHNDKEKLKEWRRRIDEFIHARLGLSFSKSEIFPVGNGLDFVGYRHFKDFILIRKRTLKRMKKRMLRIGKMNKIPECKIENARGSVAAANGWFKHACSYNLRKKLKFKKLKRMVGIE